MEVCKSVQLHAYVNVNKIIGRTKRDINTAFEIQSPTTGLAVNKTKTKHMLSAKRFKWRIEKYQVTVGNFTTIDVVNEFAYLTLVALLPVKVMSVWRANIELFLAQWSQ